MDLHELLVVKRAVTQAEREQIEGYLAHKWGLAASLPLAHPYKRGPPTRMIEVSSAATGFEHALSFFNREPMARPAGDRRHRVRRIRDRRSRTACRSADGNWHVRNMSSAGMTISGLTAAITLERARPTSPTPNSDHHAGGVPSLGSVAGRSIEDRRREQRGAASPTTRPRPWSARRTTRRRTRSTASRTSGASTRVAMRAEAAGFEPVVGLYNGSDRLPARRDVDLGAVDQARLRPEQLQPQRLLVQRQRHAQLRAARRSSTPRAAPSPRYPCGGTQPEVSGPVAQTSGGGPQVYDPAHGRS